jgi:hypothetical protein
MRDERSTAAYGCRLTPSHDVTREAPCGGGTEV